MVKSNTLRNYKLNIAIVAILISLFCINSAIAQDINTPPERPKNFKPYIYKQSTDELKRFTKDHLKRAARAVAEMEKVVYDGPYKATFASISGHKTPEWYLDAKFGIAVNYGIYSVAGHGNKGYGGNYYTDTYLDNIYEKETKGDHFLEYWGEDFEKDDFIPLFTAKNLDAEEYIKLFKKSGAKFFVQFNMHRSTGMPLWNSDYTFRDPVDMPPHRDLSDEFVQACRKYDLPYGMYLNLEDSFYPLLNDDEKIVVREWTKFEENQEASNGSFEVTHPFIPENESRTLQGKIPVYDYVNDYLLPLSKEFIDKYEPDYLWFDGGWKRPAWYYQSHKIVAYFYNKFNGRKDVLVNARMGNDLYGKLGDVIISEGGQVDNGDLNESWEEIRPFGKNFAYDWRENEDNIISSRDLIHMLVRIVAKGGNLLLIVAPDGDGVIPDYQLNRLKNLGSWLNTNGESIYNTRPAPWFCEESILGRNVYYTQSKDGKYTFAICINLIGEDLLLANVRAKPDTEVKLIGYDKPLKWNNFPWALQIALPKEIQNEINSPGEHAWVFRFERMSETEGQTKNMQNE